MTVSMMITCLHCYFVKAEFVSVTELALGWPQCRGKRKYGPSSLISYFYPCLDKIHTSRCDILEEVMDLTLFKLMRISMVTKEISMIDALVLHGLFSILHQTYRNHITLRPVTEKVRTYLRLSPLIFFHDGRGSRESISNVKLLS